MKTPSDWTEDFPAAITVCDRRGVALRMNKKSAETFSKRGGLKLLGTDLLACHPGPARAKLRRLLRSGRTNVYTIEKGGRRKLIYQAPWYLRGRFAGLVELSLELPAKVPHFVRKG